MAMRFGNKAMENRKMATGVSIVAFSHVDFYAGIGVGTVGFVLAAVRGGAKVLKITAVDRAEWRLVFQFHMLLELQRELKRKEGLDFELKFVSRIANITKDNGAALVSECAAEARAFTADRQDALATVHFSPDCSRASKVHHPKDKKERAERVKGGEEDVAVGLELFQAAKASGAFHAGTWECSVKSLRRSSPASELES